MNEIEKLMDIIKNGEPPDEVYASLLEKGYSREEIIPVRIKNEIIGYYCLNDDDKISRRSLSFNSSKIQFTDDGKTKFDEFCKRSIATQSFSIRVKGRDE